MDVECFCLLEMDEDTAISMVSLKQLESSNSDVDFITFDETCYPTNKDVEYHNIILTDESCI